MGKAYTYDNWNIVMEISLEDLINRPTMTNGDTMISMRKAIHQIAWMIINTNPGGKKMVGNRESKFATTGVVGDKFVMKFYPDLPDIPPMPFEKLGG
jgi:hypothetical protein